MSPPAIDWKTLAAITVILRFVRDVLAYLEKNHKRDLAGLKKTLTMLARRTSGWGHAPIPNWP